MTELLSLRSSCIDGWNVSCSRKTWVAGQKSLPPAFKFWSEILQPVADEENGMKLDHHQTVCWNVREFFDFNSNHYQIFIPTSSLAECRSSVLCGWPLSLLISAHQANIQMYWGYLPYWPPVLSLGGTVWTRMEHNPAREEHKDSHNGSGNPGLVTALIFIHFFYIWLKIYIFADFTYFNFIM